MRSRARGGLRLNLLLCGADLIRVVKSGKEGDRDLNPDGPAGDRCRVDAVQIGVVTDQRQLGHALGGHLARHLPLSSRAAIVTVTTFTCTGLANGVTYTFTVGAQNAAGQGVVDHLLDVRKDVLKGAAKVKEKLADTEQACKDAEKYAKDPKDEVAIVALGELAHRNPTQGLVELGKAAKAGSAARRQGAWKALAKLQAPGVETLFVSTNPASAFRIDLYRLGWYAGLGGRHVHSLGSFRGITQPDPPVGPKRLRDQLARVHYLCEAIHTRHIDDRRLRALETMDNLFPNLDWRHFAGTAP